MWIIIIIFSIFTLLSWYQAKYRQRINCFAKLKSPKSYPLVNHSWHFANIKHSEILKAFEGFAQELGPVWAFSLHPFNFQVNVNDPEIVEKILTNKKLIDKSNDYDFVLNWLGRGLLLATGKKWHQRRKVITPAFHFKILEQFVDIMDKQGNIFVSKLENFDGQHVDVFPIISLYALDVICETAMGCSINAQGDSNTNYVRAVKEMGNLTVKRIFDLLKRNDFLYKFSSLHKREKEFLDILHGFTDAVILRRRKALENTETIKEEVSEDGTKRKMALLDILLYSTIEGKPLSNNDIREEVDTFMFEGHDTTSSGIAFTLYNLAKYPKIQQKAFEECQSISGSNLTVPVKMQDLNNLNYLDLVIKESLRLYPPVPFFARSVSQDITIGKYTFPKGFSVSVSPYLMGRDPNIFGDPLRFDPHRFDIDKTCENKNQFAYTPFSAGFRNCIGQKYAILEMKSIISKVLRNFELSIAKENEELEIISELTLKSLNGIILHIKRRLQSN